MSNLVHRRLRAPQQDGAALIDPPLADAAKLIEGNRLVLSQFDQRGDFPAGFRQAARRSLMALVGKREHNFAEPLILAGHQPELFHPGVWFKNFLLSNMAQSVGGGGINLIIDNDTIRSSEIRVPTSSASSLAITAVPFDAPSTAVPWEERAILDERQFGAFRDAVAQAFGSCLNAPSYAGSMILDRLWSLAVGQNQWRSFPPSDRDQADVAGPIGVPQNLGLCLAQARHRLERELGLATAECPLSAVVSDKSFLTFAGYLLARHHEFQAIHNAALQEFRQVNHVRSHSHPVPDLAQDADWQEAPFWIWTKENPRRRRVFVRHCGNSWELTDRTGITIRARANEWPDMQHFSQQLARLGVKLRPRALVTTMYARLVLADLFIHGIGGAKYDELTDLIIRRFFGIQPPAYVTATATFRLPIERPQVSLDDVRQSAGRIRELRYRPEAFVRDPLVTRDADISPQLAALAAQKREYLDRHDLRHCSPAVFRHLDKLNRTMYELLSPVERAYRAQHSDILVQAQQARLLGSREFSFVLFPSEILPARLLDLCKVSS